MTSRKLTLVCVMGAAALLARTPTAQAANPPCSSLVGPIYTAGSSAIGPTIKGMSTALANEANPAHTIIYQNLGSCTGVSAVVNDTTPQGGACAMGACITGTATYYDKSGTQLSCDLDAMGTHVDVGLSDVFVKTCTGQAPPAGVADISGPLQPMTFIVPKTASQTAITAEEGYFVFGFGMNGMVTPWNDETQLFVRNSSSGTQNIIASTLAIPVMKMKGKDAGGSAGVLQGVVGSASPEKAIGIVSAGFYDTNRSMVKVLAFKAFKQYLAYFPDSTATSFDKRNARDGHYTPWGYLHMIAAVDGSNVPKRPGAQLFIDWQTGKGAGPWASILDLQISAGVVPLCAVSVSRAAEGADMTWTPPAKPCNCYFESKVPGSTSTCKTCAKDADCGGTMQCNNLVCESTN